MIPRATSKTLQTMDLPELRKETKTAKKEITQNQKEITKSLKSIGKPIELPKKSTSRYAERFGKKDEKTAIKILIATFAIVFVFLLFAQPSIFFVNSQKGTILENFSEREIKNLKIYSSNTIFDLIFMFNKNPVFEKEIVSPREQIALESNETSILIAFADRQLPAIGSIIFPEDYYQTKSINTSNTDNNTGLYKGLRQQIEASD